jgi:hypothetical protein
MGVLPAYWPQAVTPPPDCCRYAKHFFMYVLSSRNMGNTVLWLFCFLCKARTGERGVRYTTTGSRPQYIRCDIWECGGFFSRQRLRPQSLRWRVLDISSPLVLTFTQDYIIVTLPIRGIKVIQHTNIKDCYDQFTLKWQNLLSFLRSLNLGMEPRIPKSGSLQEHKCVQGFGRKSLRNETT